MPIAQVEPRLAIGFSIACAMTILVAQASLADGSCMQTWCGVMGGPSHRESLESYEARRQSEERRAEETARANEERQRWRNAAEQCQKVGKRFTGKRCE
jgi:hypothetical protein